MAIGCDETGARLTELLYGELPDDARAEVAAHLAGCARCQAELAALQRTRAVARRALDAGEPPVRAHQAILRAAAAAVAKPAPTEAKVAAATPRPASQPASFRDWFRRHWTWPTFATVGAVAVVALASKIFLEPEKTVERGRELVHPSVATAPAVAEPPPPPSAGEPVEATKNPALEKDLEDRGRQAQPASGAARPKTDVSASEHRRVPERDGLSGLASHGKGGVGSGAAPRGGPADDFGASEGFAPPPPPAAKPAKHAFAPPPAAGKKSAEPMDDLLDGEMERSRDQAPGRAGGGAPPEANRAAPPKAKKEVAADLAREAPAAAPPPAPAPAATSASEPASSEDKAVAESPVARADRLFTAGRWAEAARAYRELLRRDPRNPEAGRWRQRLSAAEAALASPP